MLAGLDLSMTHFQYLCEDFDVGQYSKVKQKESIQSLQIISELINSGEVNVGLAYKGS